MYIGVVLADGKHTTLTFHGHEETIEEYKRAVASVAEASVIWEEGNGTRIDLEFLELGIFEPSGAWHTKVDSLDLRIFRELLTIQLLGNGVPYSKDFDFAPHVTLTYFKKPKKNPYEGLTIPVSHISVVSDTYGTTNILI